MSDRDTLADVIHMAICEDSPEECQEWGGKCVRAARDAAGWRPPAPEITTAEELEALAAPSVVFDRFGVAWQSTRQPDGGILWFADGHEPRAAAKMFDPYVFERDQLCGSITVLYVPTEETDRA